MKERLHDAFPNILEIRIENIRNMKLKKGTASIAWKNALLMICVWHFWGKMAWMKKTESL